MLYQPIFAGCFLDYLDYLSRCDELELECYQNPLTLQEYVYWDTRWQRDYAKAWHSGPDFDTISLLESKLLV